MTTRDIHLSILAVIIFGIAAWYALLNTNEAVAPTIDSGTQSGSSDYSYINASSDLIVIDLPTLGAVVGKEFSATGKARGVWYFEASFPVAVLDKDGNILTQVPAQAQGEWMTEEFVPFKADLKVPNSYIGPATIVLKKDNPSGLSEHDASVSFPITIEY